jgi:hypothetical protein
MSRSEMTDGADGMRQEKQFVVTPQDERSTRTDEGATFVVSKRDLVPGLPRGRQEKPAASAVPERPIISVTGVSSGEQPVQTSQHGDGTSPGAGTEKRKDGGDGTSRKVGLKEVADLVPREETIRPVKELLLRKKESIGETPDQRLDWLLRQEPAELSQFLIDINKTVRGIRGEHRFDGEGAQAGKSILESVPPDHEDKEPILHEAITSIQERSKQMQQAGVSSQGILDHFAVAIPTLANKLHLFGSGDGRATRVLRMFMRDGYANLDARVEAAIMKQGHDTYDTTLVRPVERTVTNILREQHGTKSFYINDDLQGEEDLHEFDELDNTKARAAFEGLDPRIADSQIDTLNLYETVRVYAQNQGLGEEAPDGGIDISLRELFSDMVDHPGKQAEYLSIYRQVRKERAAVLGKILTGEIKGELAEKDRKLDVVNNVRAKKEQTLLSPDDVTTTLQLQTAYEESRSPIREEQESKDPDRILILK